MNLTSTDIELLKSKGLTEDKVTAQIHIFKKGIPFVTLTSAASLSNGILRFSDAQQKELKALYQSRVSDLDTLKFVPASGAASRMFKDLFQFLNTYDPEKESLNAYVNHANSGPIRLFLIGLEKFPFYGTIREKIDKEYPNFTSLSEGKQLLLFVEILLKENGLNFGMYPKGLLPFHTYETNIATAFEEHLYEAAAYAKDTNNQAKLHFTISENHLEGFNKEFEKIKEEVQEQTDTTFHITYSFQKPETDTIAVTENDEPFRKEDGSILFRPGGHGALIENLNDLESDIIYIKNIDNVVVHKYQKEIADFKKILAGKLIEIRDRVFKILTELDHSFPTKTALKDITEFLTTDLNTLLPHDFAKFSEEQQLAFLKQSLNRPIRICGMVINEGEPGGGPFWIQQENGEPTLQIIETPQINKNDPGQQAIMASATHFNPVDLVCGIRDYKGNKFNLLDFIDPEAGFITKKSLNGKTLKALELPGLWNGAMANWISVFVEVPLTSFNPVKTVNDLLKSAHQVKLFS